MPYAIIALDQPGSDERRAALKAQHLDYLCAKQQQILAGGALQDDDGQAVGGLLLIDAEDREAAEQFVRDDPYSTGQVFGEVRVLRWKLSFFDRQRCTA